MYADLSRSYEWVEGTEAVEFYVRTGETVPTTDPVPVAHAKRRAPNKFEVGPGGALLHGVQLIWHLWRVEMGNRVPKVGDVVAGPDGVRWVVMGVDVQSVRERFRCQCRQEV